MTNQVIPAEAVEAAAKALWEPSEHGDEWAGEYKTYKDYLRAQASQVLEASAPYIRAQWYEEGVQAVRDALLAFTDERDNALGAIRSHITTYELRKLLGATDD